MLIAKTVPYTTIVFDSCAAFIKNIWRIINTVAFICFNNIHRYFFRTSICSSTLRAFMGFALGKFMIPSPGPANVSSEGWKSWGTKANEKTSKTAFWSWKTKKKNKTKQTNETNQPNKPKSNDKKETTMIYERIWSTKGTLNIVLRTDTMQIPVQSYMHDRVHPESPDSYNRTSSTLWDRQMWIQMLAKKALSGINWNLKTGQ